MGLETKKGTSKRSPFQAAVARLTGLEPATPGVTGRYSNQLSYNRSLPVRAGPNVIVYYGSCPEASSTSRTKDR